MEKTVKTVSAMENVKAMGITMECVSSDKMQTLKASCTANTDIKIVCCADYAEKKHLEKIAAIEKHIAHVKANITSVKKIECVYCADRADMQKKKKYHTYLEKMFNADNKATDPKTEKKSTVIPTSPEKAKAIGEKAKADYKKSVELDKAIKTRKPEKLNEYSCNSNTLITSIDYTNTDLKEIERLKNKWSKIGLSNGTFELLEKSKIENEVEKIKRKAVKRTNKNIVKKSNAALKTIKDNVNTNKEIATKFTSEVKRCTLRREFIGYAKRFKQSFIKIVNAEYSEKTKNVYKYKKTVVKQSAKKPAKFKLEKTPLKLFYLTCKKSRLAKKIADLDKKINACISVINQLEKIDINKINYNLIATKLQTIGGFDTDECTLVEIQAVKNQLANTLHNTMSALDNIENRIDVIKNIDTAYSKIKNGNEIIIDITTNQLVNNVYFRICCGYNCTNDNSTSALLHIRKLVKKTMQSINISGYNAEINYNVFENVNTILPLARQITKRQSFNMVQRQGSKTQYAIYYACMRNDFTDHDTADILSVAYTQILTCLSVKNPAILLKVKNVLSALNAKIQHLHYTIDIDKIKKYVFAANNFLKYELKYTDILATRDYNKNKRLITLLENMYNAVKNKNVTALKTSVYNAINEYLTSIRSIRENDKMTLNLDDYINRMSNADYNADNETLITNPYADDDNAEIKRKILFECYKNVKKCINNSTAKTFDLMCRGYSEIQISEKRKISKPAISEQITEIKQAFIKCYTDIKNNENNKEVFKNNPIVFDPSVFDDCKTISEKSEKIITTYQKNTEIDKIKKAVSEMPLTEYKCMKYNFKKFLDGFNTLQRQIYIKLLENNASDRKIADFLEIKRDRVKDLREKIIKTIQKIIEEYTIITIDKTALKKTPLSVYVNFFAIA